MLYRNDNIRLSPDAASEELWNLLRDSRPDVFLSAVYNKNLTEDMAVYIAKNRNTASEILGMLAADIRFKGSYKLKIAICNNPRTPQNITLSLIKFLRIFDLADITRKNNIPIAIRQKTEHSIMEKISSLPSGVKIALARRASQNIIIYLLKKGDKKLIHACLESPLLTEELLFRLISNVMPNPLLIRAVAEHSKWSLRYRVRYALVRNYYTPMSYVIKFVNSLKTTDLRELYLDSSLPLSTKPYLFSELCLRDQCLEARQRERYILLDDEEPDFADSDQPL